MNVNLNIEALVLDGLPQHHGPAIGKALQAELARLLTEQGLPAPLTSGGDAPALSRASFNVTPGATPEAIGVQLARTLYAGFGQ